jgi:hypothetical protein|uniref:Uncharacterized protein n=1 Tax=Siphoviridae sp. cttU829 TaxID=2823605 RepID=A0A8S5LCG8_9CAUD|nr:MAG TPA: hypothetical protein [Siphoviridae sp. cttU829]DAN49423.1 MAG TPA: hypothetical protein [Caudoviricetes sp.]
MANNHILTADKFRELARPTSRHIEEQDVNAFIRECEDMQIIPAIGLGLFKKLLDPDTLGEKEKTLLVGGEYEHNGVLRKCAGIEIALAYFVYAKMSIADGGMLTRTGMMQHRDSYADREDNKNRIRRYDEAMNVAESYLSSCLAYINTWDADKCGRGGRKVYGSRVRIHAIGD